MARLNLDREEVIEEAREKVEGGLAIRTAAREAGIPESTLRGRLAGSSSRSVAKEPDQKLSAVQEEAIKNWILNEEAAGRAPTRKQVRGFAELILSHGGCTEPLGINWVDRFVRRNPDIKMKPSEALEAERAAGTTEEGLRAFWDRLDAEIKAKSIGKTRLYNFDETGIVEGEFRAGRVLGSSLTKRSIVVDGGTGQWVTILECVSASGQRLTPCVVYTGSRLQGQWFPEEVPNWKYDCTPSGWANNRSLWRILLLDGHKAHVTDELMYEAYLNKVQLLYLPPHTSHATQPLDVGVYGPLKTNFRELTRGLHSHDATAPVQKQRFLKIYEKASARAFTVDNVKGGFRGAGIYPTNVERALQAIVKPAELPGVEPTEAGPSTPKRAKITKDHIWYTPQSSREVRAQLDLVRRDLDGIDRGVRTIASKAGKEIDKKNSQVAALEEKVAFLEAERDSKQPTGRRTVQYDANEAFARAPEVSLARIEARQAANRYQERHGPHLHEDALEVAQNGQEKMEFQFQV
ncbi:hypothetical protein HIM_11285 [Hirsutella minnesotensis 3608]|uniref:HTH CENPB-type domain-containing protein n=1 Tax=Hirsutella minnesotensis 3608 TaxID=1043627 RepID=A0A0F7ZWP4_9HYPO|nr:hypothetical protein HIM_11285 [Hirsutella minnesotensis 3608]